MAAPMSSGDEKSDTDAIPDYLDPTSASFDPLKALYSPIDPFPHIPSRQFNNLAQFQNFIEGKDAQTRKANEQKKKSGGQQGTITGLAKLRAQAHEAEQERKAAITKKYAGPAERSITQAKRKNMRTVFTKMQGYKKGPLNVLRLCVNDKLRVTVLIRAAVSVRSRCRGYLVAFDKHFNMALMDVDETFIRPAPKRKGIDKKGKQTEAVSSICKDSDRTKSSAKAVRVKSESENRDKQGSDLRKKIDENMEKSDRRSLIDHIKENEDKESSQGQRFSRKLYDSKEATEGYRTSSDSRYVIPRKGDNSDFSYQRDRSDSEGRKDHRSSSGSRRAIDKSESRNSYRSSSNDGQVGERSKTNQRSSSYDKRGKGLDQRWEEHNIRGKEHAKERGKEHDKQKMREPMDDKLNSSTASIASKIGMIDLREKLKKNRLKDSGASQCMSDSENNPSTSRPEHSVSDSESGKQQKEESIRSYSDKCFVSDSESRKHIKEESSKCSNDKTEMSSGLFWPKYKKWTEDRCYAEYEIVERHVNQLFIRGDNVVSIHVEDF
ncbi:zinc finger CCCH domain-containing protein 13-like [Dreissena polymorpha]|uniref:LSM domain-containing protein n=1 Tax=Dreissena polymorpha TaxID=45954 RepID=A0A9D4M7Z3_DREPO|nr:zinc finger CCCH domain-containing protein 13-like [Dreissena polymorpha]KAH3869996.1 hypothetical protein DPMN_033174 [Dreissena polymorpha]